MSYVTAESAGTWKRFIILYANWLVICTQKYFPVRPHDFSFTHAVVLAVVISTVYSSNSTTEQPYPFSHAALQSAM